MVLEILEVLESLGRGRGSGCRWSAAGGSAGGGAAGRLVGGGAGGASGAENLEHITQASGDLHCFCVDAEKLLCVR